MQKTTAVRRSDTIFNCIRQTVPIAQERATITLGRVTSSIVSICCRPAHQPSSISAVIRMHYLVLKWNRVTLCWCSVCPSISLIALSGSPCPATGEIIVNGSASVSFNCTYDNPLGQTDYKWYLDGVRQSAFKSYRADMTIPTGSHVVKCEAVINESADCICQDSQTVNVAAIGT